MEEFFSSEGLDAVESEAGATVVDTVSLAQSSKRDPTTGAEEDATHRSAVKM
ncbi:hypothetical protein [Hydrogenophaga taeniospiralis]|uniref:hypothetical protein n=1 Tax=Hydrogenophaga taeniospiralis TaxID=65656 RepID=UPI001CFA7FC1|nr:hypothetical protein [Hydrogenophaga taeniospiralis]UCU95209.1 hypothetical protein KI616_04925 [Hydrogenophaga taeniospiralis]